MTSPSVLGEYAEIEVTVEEERKARKDLGWKEAFFGKGNFIRFVIAHVLFMFQLWSGQTSVGCVIIMRIHGFTNFSIGTMHLKFSDLLATTVKRPPFSLPEYME